MNVRKSTITLVPDLMLVGASRVGRHDPGATQGAQTAGSRPRNPTVKINQLTMFRGFSMSGEVVVPPRTIDNDAPPGMRQELVDLWFHFADTGHGNQPNGPRVYGIIMQSLGEGVNAEPYGGYRHEVGNAIQRADWPRVYDVVLRFVPDLDAAGAFDDYRGAVNRILAGNGVVWDLNEHGRLVRVLPHAGLTAIGNAFQELSSPQFAPALPLFNAARDAYDERPRRDRDACSNAFDAMESAAKIKNNMPHATFGQVLAAIEPTGVYHVDTIVLLRSLNNLRNHHFGHGMATPFVLSPHEVDLTYLSCIGGILLFTRTP